SAEIPLEEIRKVCPAYRGKCYCRICLRGDNLIKPKVQEIPDIDKLRYLHRITAQTYVEQCSEIGMETRINGPKVDIPRAKVNADERMCWGSVFIEIFFPAVISAKSLLEGGFIELQVPERSKDIDTVITRVEQHAKRTNNKSLSWIADENTIDFAHLFPAWKAKNDGSIPWGADAVNWIGKLVKNTEEMVKGCKVRDLDYSDRCSSCKGVRNLESKDSSDLVFSGALTEKEAATTPCTAQCYMM
ncbi:hypothetical protein ACMD2_05965, partial [Ananas comosus]